MNAVTLSTFEIMQAALVGVMRQCQNIRAGRVDAHGASNKMGWQLHIEGACGEMAVAKHFGIFWNGNIGNLRADDVGDLQVRTRSRHNYDLILHPSDPDDKAFILVTGVCPGYQLRGWILGSAGKKPEFWKDPAGGRPAFFVPTEQLEPLDTLRGAA